MKFSKQWIQSYLDTQFETADIVHTLTMAGLEVDSTEIISALPFPDKAQVAKEQDTLIEIDLTPNRGDCLSIQGVARELAVLKEVAYQAPEVSPITAELKETLSIQCQAPEHCPRYVGRLIKDINSHAKTPDWIAQRLERVDIRCVHPVVDILNYVMIEMGQPMHAFDASKINGGITIRLSKECEKIKLLDEQEITLKAGTLLIADDKVPLAIAGIMGGLDSGVTESTKNILLESALFTNHTQQGQARQYGLHTDSSFRFERGVDPALQIKAIERATELIQTVCGGTACDNQVIESKEHLRQSPQITLRPQRIKLVLGIAIEAKQIKQMLERMGCQCQLAEFNNQQVVQVAPPSHRYDLNIEVDLIEELARIHGYENIEPQLPMIHISQPNQNEHRIPQIRLKQALVDMGYIEAINYSFTDSQLQQRLFNDEAIALLNPISQDMDVMRVSILPGLLKTLQFNQNRQQNRVMLFELGDVYLKDTNGNKQITKLAGLCVGQHFPETWRQSQRTFDFYDLKGQINLLWQLTAKSPLSFKPIEHHLTQKGLSAEILSDGTPIGLMGKLSPERQKELDLEGDIYWFECDIEPFLEKRITKLVRPSKFPEIRRDIAVIVDNEVASQTLTEYVGNMADNLLQQMYIFDEYKGKGIEKGRKSIALGLILQHPSRTLVDDEVNTLMQSIIDGLKKDFAAELRD